MSSLFTDRARAALKRLLDSEAHEPGQLIRIITDMHGDHHLVWGRQEPGDDLVTWEGQPVLVIQSRIAGHLREHHPGGVLDVNETPDGPTLVMKQAGDR